jgi:hypothetical protein
MIRQAEKAGLTFDSEKLVEMGVLDALTYGDANTNNDDHHPGEVREAPISNIRINISSPSPLASPELKNEGQEKDLENGQEKWQENWGHFKLKEHAEKGEAKPRPFHEMMHKAHIARIHDSLEFSSGLGKIQVLSWKFMEYLPFRRMDLQPDGSWKPIRWPLPAGETRDIPHTARIHGSVIRRMKQDATYRPGNLIVGGGGRGLRRALEEHGIGEWECVEGHGDPVDEVWVKKCASPIDL